MVGNIFNAFNDSRFSTPPLFDMFFNGIPGTGTLRAELLFFLVSVKRTRTLFNDLFLLLFFFLDNAPPLKTRAGKRFFIFFFLFNGLALMTLAAFSFRSSFVLIIEMVPFLTFLETFNISTAEAHNCSVVQRIKQSRKATRKKITRKHC